jgi:hypothetical protein
MQDSHDSDSKEADEITEEFAGQLAAECNSVEGYDPEQATVSVDNITTTGQSLLQTDQTHNARPRVRPALIEIPSTRGDIPSSRDHIAAKLEIEKQLAIFQLDLLSDVEHLKLEVVSAAITELCALAQLNARQAQTTTMLNQMTSGVSVRIRPAPASSVMPAQYRQQVGNSWSFGASNRHATVEEEDRLAAEMLTDARRDEVGLEDGEGGEGGRRGSILGQVLRRSSLTEVVEGAKDVAKRLFAVVGGPPKSSNRPVELPVPTGSDHRRQISPKTGGGMWRVDLLENKVWVPGELKAGAIPIPYKKSLKRSGTNNVFFSDTTRDAKPAPKASCATVEASPNISSRLMRAAAQLRTGSVNMQESRTSPKQAEPSHSAPSSLFYGERPGAVGESRL